MRVMLVQPGLPVNLNLAPQFYPPLGLMCLAAYLRRNRPDDEIRIIDAQANKLDPPAVAAEASRFRPDVVGITSMSIHAPAMREIAGLLKATNPDATLVVGGPHAMAAPESILSDSNIDAVAQGEGEETFLELVNALDSPKTSKPLPASILEDIPGIATRDGHGSITSAPPRPYIENLDDMPFPARDLIDMTKFFHFSVPTQNDMRAHRRFTTIFTSRACPYKCIFCHNVFGKKFRYRSAGNILEEMASLRERYGIREFHIIDDCFNLKIDRAREVMEGIIDRGWNIKMAFPNGVRSDRLPDDLLDLMKRAGVYKMNFGVEAGSERIQKLIHKSLDLEVARDAIARADAMGIITHGFFMLGFPTETVEEMEQTVRFACSSKLMMAGFFFVNPYPNTELHRLAKEKGLVDKFDGADSCYYDMGVNVSAASDEALNRAFRTAYRRFYSNPLRMAKIIARIPRKTDLLRAVKANLKVKFL